VTHSLSLSSILWVRNVKKRPNGRKALEFFVFPLVATPRFYVRGPIPLALARNRSQIFLIADATAFLRAQNIIL